MIVDFRVYVRYTFIFALDDPLKIYIYLSKFPDTYICILMLEIEDQIFMNRYMYTFSKNKSLEFDINTKYI